MSNDELEKLIHEENNKRKLVPKTHKHFNEIYCYVFERTRENMKKFKPRPESKITLSSYVLTLIRCYFHEATRKMTRDISLERGNCDNCVVKKMMEI